MNAARRVAWVVTQPHLLKSPAVSGWAFLLSRQVFPRLVVSIHYYLLSLSQLLLVQTIIGGTGCAQPGVLSTRFWLML
jgi:hypothetical protein